MARQSYAETQIPAEGKDAVPYPDWRQIAFRMFTHAVDAFVGEILGAAAAGGDLAGIPFEPAAIVLSEATGPLIQLQIPASGGKLDINLVTGVAAGTAIPAAVQQPDGTWTLSLPTGLVPDGDTASLLILGFRDVAGGL